MDSPETNPKVPNSSFSASSPTHQESSLFRFLENLSPIGSVKATKYSQRYQLFNFPTPSPVFTSPRMDSQRQTSFLKREESNVADSNVCVKSDTQKQEKPELVPCFKKENEHCGSPGSIEAYLAIDDHVDSSGAVKQSNSIAGDSFAANVEGKDASDSVKQLDNQSKCVSGPLNDHFQSDVFLNSLNGAELDHQLVVQEGYNHQQSICRHLQFEAVMNQKDPKNEIHNSSNFSLASNLRSFESLVQPLVDSTETCISSGLQYPVSLSMGSKDKQMHDRNQRLSKNLDTISAGEKYFHGEDDRKENRAIAVAGPNTPQSAQIMHPPGDSSRVSRFKQLAAPWETAHHTLQKSNIDEDLNQLSSKKDRKKAKLSSENEGCKRCNCKRSRCLKLYCDCFASGVYCVDSCSCENCYNKPEYEDTVLDTRQKIENRNPLAFAPKVVKHPTKSPANIMELNLVTPSSARHKRGCNCKRSKCLKKYCECYQARVGCSDGCRCEDCSNSFGKKTELVYRRAKRLVTPSYELADITNLSPLPHPHSGIVTSSASRSYSRALQVHPNQGSNLHASAGYLGFHSSAANHSPKSYGSKGLAELSSESPDSFLFDIFKENYSPDIKNNSSTSISPNQKQELSSRSPPGLRSRRKFNLRTVSPFPPLTPYSSSKDGIHK